MNFTSTQDEGFVKALEPHGLLDYRPGWLATGQAGALYACLAEQIAWQSRTITLFGRTMLQPRLLYFMGDEGVRYRYSNDEYRAGAWHPAVLELKHRLHRELGAEFNSVLLNLYRNGRDSMGWHSDDEPELGRNPLIASVSLGARRRFVVRHEQDRALRHELQPAHGSLIVMSGDMQHHWQHQVPRTATAVGARINLTFRRIRSCSRSRLSRRPPRRQHRP